MESGFCLNFQHRCEVVFGGTVESILVTCVFEFRQVVLVRHTWSPDFV